MVTIERIERKQQAILVGLKLPGENLDERQEHLVELELLAKTAGLKVDCTVMQERIKVHPTNFIGPGKAIELSDMIHRRNVKVVIFDDDLTPAQIRNLEKIWNSKVIDRTALILDIFAKHAKSKEAKTQVELAQLQYLLPRLTRQWTHLSRQVGGIGIRGPGETQLETDRRLIRRRIEKLRSDLIRIDKQQSTRRKHRNKIYRVALVGYTNVGKSTIMNILSGADVLVENQLFATLDSIIRKVKLNGNHEILLSDTVGFIRKLPTHLIASFKSTLDEVREADLLLHVIDVQHPRYCEQMKIVLKVLEELNVHHKPIIMVFNKIDKLHELNLIPLMKAKYPDAVFLSAIRHIGIEALKTSIVQHIEQNYITAILNIPVDDQKSLHFIHSCCHIVEKSLNNGYFKLVIKCNKEILNQIQNLNNRISFLKDTEHLMEDYGK